MARIRTIKPGFFTSEDVAALSLAARLTWIGLWTYVDDAGRGKANPALVKAAVWPLEDHVTSTDVLLYLDELEDAGRIRRYTIESTEYLVVVDFDKHQRINRPTPSSFPPPPDDTPPAPITRDSLTTHGANTDTSLPEGEGKGSGRGEGTHALTRERPAPHCHRHPGGTDDPCRACGDARRAHDAWTPPPTPTPPSTDELANAPRCKHGDIVRTVNGLPACPLCRANPAPTMTVVKETA